MGGMHGRESMRGRDCVHGKGECLAGACMVWEGVMCGKGHVWQGGMCGKGSVKTVVLNPSSKIKYEIEIAASFTKLSKCRRVQSTLRTAKHKVVMLN